MRKSTERVEQSRPTGRSGSRDQDGNYTLSISLHKTH